MIIRETRRQLNYCVIPKKRVRKRERKRRTKFLSQLRLFAFLVSFAMSPARRWAWWPLRSQEVGVASLWRPGGGAGTPRPVLHGILRVVFVRTDFHVVVFPVVFPFHEVRHTCWEEENNGVNVCYFFEVFVFRFLSLILRQK